MSIEEVQTYLDNRKADVKSKEHFNELLTNMKANGNWFVKESDSYKTIVHINEWIVNDESDSVRAMTTVEIRIGDWIDREFGAITMFASDLTGIRIHQSEYTNISLKHYNFSDWSVPSKGLQAEIDFILKMFNITI